MSDNDERESTQYVNPLTGCSGPCCLPPTEYIEAVENLINADLQRALAYMEKP